MRLLRVFVLFLNFSFLSFQAQSAGQNTNANATTRASATSDLKVQWDCAQSNPQSRSIPEKNSIAVPASWDGKKLVVNFQNLKSYIAKNTATSTNYYLCNRDLLRSFYNEAIKLCPVSESFQSACKDQVKAAYTSLEENLDSNPNKLPLFIPGESFSQVPSQYDLETARGACIILPQQLSREYVDKSLNSYLKELDPECRRHSIDNAIQNLTKEYNDICLNPESETCKRYGTALPAVLSKINFSSDKPATGLCAKNPKVIEQLRALNEQIIQANRCRIQQAGTTRIIDNLDNPNMRFNKFALTKIGNGNYRVDLKIKFQPMNTNGPVTTADLDKMKQNLSECMYYVNKKMKGPNGEKIEIHVNESTAPQKLPETNITVSQGLPRQDSQNWGPDIKCSTMTHEMMHLLGFIDEYEEQEGYGFIVDPVTGEKLSGLLEEKPKDIGKNKFVRAFDCRSTSVSDSIMSGHPLIGSGSGALNAALGSKEYATCTCNETDAKKCAYLNSLNKENVHDKCLGDKVNEASFGADIPFPPMPKNVRKIVYNKYPASRDSILYPAQFRQLIQPGCKKYVGVFLECTKDAGLSSQQIGKCPEKPPACKDKKAWLR